jgi:DNA polymerase III delta prime subunit
MQSYKLSFTAAGLALADSVKVAEVYLSCKDWKKTREILSQNNILQSRTISRNKRVVSELIKRLSLLTDEQLLLLAEGNLEEQKLLLWFVVCKTYLFVREFAVEVLHQKFRAMDKHMSNNDLQAFFLRKLDTHGELGNITESTKNKLFSQVFHMLREADLLGLKNQILRVIPSRRLSIALSPDTDFAYTIYPAFPEEFELNL